MKKILTVSMTGLIASASIIGHAHAGSERPTFGRIRSDMPHAAVHVADPSLGQSREKGGVEYEGRKVVVTDAATAADPVVIDYQQPATVMFSPPWESGVYTSVRIASKRRFATLHVKAEWKTPSASDIDLFLFDACCTEDWIASSEGWNIDVVDEFEGNRAGAGYEYLPDVDMRPRARYSVATAAWHSAGERVTLKVWLSRH